MKKLVMSLALMMAFTSLFAQDDEAANDTINGWHRFGNVSLMFNQAAFNADWQEGGTSNYSGNLNLDYAMNYKQDRLSWDNNLRAELGLTKNKGEKFERKTSDRLELNSVVGYQVKEDSRWSYSFFGNFKTQFVKGYEYDEDAGTRAEVSRFMSPGYLKFGPGMLYKNGELLKVNIAPATARFIFVNNMFTVPSALNDNQYEDGDYYGVDAGKSMRFEFGASLDLSSKMEIVKNVEMTNLLSLYSNYLEDPQNVDIDYTFKLDMKVNEWLSANFVFQAIYDDNSARAFQIREALGVGLSYKLN